MLQIGKFYYYFLPIYEYKHSVYRLIQGIEIYFPYVKLMSWLLNCKGKWPVTDFLGKAFMTDGYGSFNWMKILKLKTSM